MSNERVADLRRREAVVDDDEDNDTQWNFVHYAPKILACAPALSSHDKRSLSAIVDIEDEQGYSIRKLSHRIASIAYHRPVNLEMLQTLDAVVSETPCVKNVMPRGGGGGELPMCDKLDFQMSESWINSVKASASGTPLQDLVTEAQRILFQNTSAERVNETWNCILTFGGSVAQDWHADCADAPEEFFTILVDLVADPKSGGTEFPAMEDDGSVYLVDAEDEVADSLHAGTRAISYGCPVLFGGNVMHRGGTSQNEANTRISLMITLSLEQDPNNVIVHSSECESEEDDDL